MSKSFKEIRIDDLCYTNDGQPGIYRNGDPGKFLYRDSSGKTISDQRVLDRIKKIVIPPAWTRVWIAPKANAHLQATGIDAAGRKQYRYHPSWVSKRSEAKYDKLLQFGKSLPKARAQILKDLARKRFDERKILAICTQLMIKTLIRVGNHNYEALYGTYGLSTLKSRHVKIDGNQLKISFIGKKGVKQMVTLNDRRLARLVRRCKDIPGQDLFQFYISDYEHHRIDSGMINSYIKEVTGGDFTAKDFRTWGGTLEALRQLAKCASDSEKQRPKKTIVSEVLDCVAAKLGNTKAVCKSSYVFPALLEAFEQDKLQRYLKKVNHGTEKPDENETDEKVLLSFLKSIQKSR